MQKIAHILYKRPFLSLFLFLVIAYLPVFLPFFHLKNDLISQNLPTRYVISESLYSGYFPWWNPYINFGIPQYGDMNNGFWNPVMWLIAKTFGYNIWTITYEEMLYILLGGWGIYKVTRELGIQKGIAIISAISYMSCGYISGHLQYLCWITGTAFFPYVLLYFLKINKKPVFKNFILGALTVFLFVASTHPGLIIGAAYFFLFALVTISIFRKNYTRSLYPPKFLLVNGAFLMLGIVFSIGVLISDLDVLRHISRGIKVNLKESLLAPTTFQSYLSILFPVAVNKSSLFDTDVSMRNVFVGIAGLSGFIFFVRFANRKVLTAAMTFLLFFILLSAGGIFKTFFYYTVPLVGYVRLNGEFTYFVLVILLLTGAYGLQKFLANVDVDLLKKLRRFFLGVCLIAMLAAVLVILFSHSSIIYSSGLPGKDFKLAAKNILDRLHFFDLLLISGSIQLITFLIIGKNFSPTKTAFAVTFNLVLNTWLVLPFADLGMKSKQQIHREMAQFPRGLFTQELQSLSKTKFLDSTLKNEFLLLGSYSKKIGYPHEEQYPIELKTTRNFFDDSNLHHFITSQSFIFLSTDTTTGAQTSFDSSILEIKEMGAGYLRLTADNSEYRFITFLQTDYPYWQTFINGRSIEHYRSFKTFMSVPIEKGKQEIEFLFKPSPIKKAIFINVAIILIGILSLLHPQLRNRSLFD